MQKLLVIACVTFGCVSPDDPERSAAEQAEARSGGGAPGGDSDCEEGVDETGETVCVHGTVEGSGWDAGWWFPGPGTGGGQVQPPRPPGGGGGGTGPGGGGPGRKPDRKLCDQQDLFPTIDSCKDCCQYNYNHVDGWECNRKPRNERRQCWEDAGQVMGACQAKCERDRRPITAFEAQ